MSSLAVTLAEMSSTLVHEKRYRNGVHWSIKDIVITTGC